MAEPEEISLSREIDSLASKHPFQSFAITMASGSKYEIGVKDAVVVGRTVIVIYPSGGGQHLLQQRQLSEVTVAGGAP